jgi:hypothetical protein
MSFVDAFKGLPMSFAYPFKTVWYFHKFEMGEHCDAKTIFRTAICYRFELSREVMHLFVVQLESVYA